MDAYAAKVLRPGDTEMISHRAENPDRDMKSIVPVLWQAGVGFYPTLVNILKAENAKRFSGYLSRKTPAEFNLKWDQFERPLGVRDSQMNRSQPVKLPLIFDLAADQTIPEKWQAAAIHQIGPLMFVIESSRYYNRGRF